MKSEHRHELAQNDLEVLGKKLGKKSKDYWEENGNRILLYVSLALLLLAAFIFWTRNNEATNLAAWSRFNGASNAADFAQVAQDFEGTDVGHWANLRVAEINLTNATQQMFQDTETAQTELKTVLDSLEKQANTSGKPEKVEVRVLYALARAQETLSDGDTAKAVATYEKLMSKFPDSVHSEFAKQRIDELNRETTSEFYAWFSKQKFEPEKQIDLPKDGKIEDDSSTDEKSAVPPVPGFSGEKKMKVSDKEEEKKSDEKPADKNEDAKKESSEKPMAKPEAKTEKKETKPAEKPEVKKESPKVEKKADEKKETPKPEAKKEDSKPTEKPKADKPKADKPKEEAKKEDKKE